MKLLKRTVLMAAAAVITIWSSIGCALAANADSVFNAGNPTGADFLIPDTNASQNSSENNTGTSVGAGLFVPDTPSDDGGTSVGAGLFVPSTPDPSPPAIGSPNRKFQPVENYEEWVLWDGTTELLDNTNYYINDTVELYGDFTLPSNSTLLIDNGMVMHICSGSEFLVYGTVIAAPRAEMGNSGTFSVMKGGLFENFGNTKFTQSSVLNISSDFAAYVGSQTIFAGNIYVYSKGKVTNCGIMSVSKDAEVKITGSWFSNSSGLLYIDGKLTTTLNGMLDLAGFTSIQANAQIVNSGRIFIQTSVKYYVNKNVQITNTKSGRIIDYRDPMFSADTVEFENGIKGIDVSKWQGVIDWQRVKEAGIQFAIIRASVGSGVDPLFDYNITEAKKAGILVGVYHYCYALNTQEAIEEARHFINTISPYQIDYPVMFDFEDNSQVKLGKERLTAIAQAFLSELKRAGYYPMIYSYRNWLQNYLDMDRLSEYEVAVAEWNVAAPNYDRPYGIWQYSCKGQISGIDGDVDLDICYKDYARIILEGGYNRLK